MEKQTRTHVFFVAVSLFILTSALWLASCSNIKKQSWNDSEVINPKYREFAGAADSYLTESGFQGAVLIGRGDKIVFAKGYGVCDVKAAAPEKVPIGINSTFEAGSISKQMTAAAVMQLVEKKKLAVDDKISKFFSDFEAGDKITIEMLLNMRSGLTDHINSADEFFPKNIYRHIEVNQMACKPVDKNLVLTYLSEAPLLAEPDSTYFYCNTNYYLLASIIEQVSGMSYSEYIQKNIFARCGMNHSNLEFQKTDTRGYDYKGRYYSIPAALALGCGDVNSNVTDLFKWNILFTSGKVVKKKTFQKMIDSESYGYGVYRHDDSIFHAGVTNVFNSYDGYYFDGKVSVIVLCNCPVVKINATSVARNLYKLYEENNN
ncbi:serine hydrolase domain-containing protein [Treponema bryantii]|uniref:serine hydrolase domain-containing protein n=1 Tax=Treponema bryantii TaxID=163 RepID=UPI002B296122|nr:D-Ala-D-Ala carboxypeptidase [Treponema bryantii]